MRSRVRVPQLGFMPLLVSAEPTLVEVKIMAEIRQPQRSSALQAYVFFGYLEFACENRAHHLYSCHRELDVVQTIISQGVHSSMRKGNTMRAVVNPKNFLDDRDRRATRRFNSARGLPDDLSSR